MMHEYETMNVGAGGGGEVRRRGRPCAVERLRNELMQQKLTSLINSSPESSASGEFAKLNILPFIVKRQRRVRANDRERSRMQSLNGALRVLRQHLPVDMLMQATPDLECNQKQPIIQDKKSNRKQRNGGNKKEDAKVTKIDTLRMATKYISMLSDLLNNSRREEKCEFMETSMVDSVAATVHSTKTCSSSAYESADSPESPPPYQYGYCSHAKSDINANYYNTVDSNYYNHSGQPSVFSHAASFQPASSSPMYFNGNAAHAYSTGHQGFYGSYADNSYSQFLRSSCVKYA